MKKTFSILLCIIALNFVPATYSYAAFSEKTIPAYQQILTMLETNLDVKNSRKGDLFRAKLMDDVFLDEKTILIPTNSMISGQILKVKKANRFRKDSYIKLEISLIEYPAGERISLNPSYKTDIFAPGSKRFKKKLIDKLPSSIASTGSSFILGQSSSLARSAIWGISMGAGICAGAVSGFITPDTGKTKVQTGAKRAIDSTPAGSLNLLLSRGKNFSLKSGQFITIYLDKKAIKLLKG